MARIHSRVNELQSRKTGSPVRATSDLMDNPRATVQLATSDVDASSVPLVTKEILLFPVTCVLLLNNAILTVVSALTLIRTPEGAIARYYTDNYVTTLLSYTQFCYTRYILLEISKYHNKIFFNLV